MQQSEAAEFRRLIEQVYDFYGKDASAFVFDVWWTAMRAFDLAAVREALGRHAMNPDTGQFLPRPADVVKMLGGSTQDSALQAWSQVDRAVRSVGPYQSIAFDDPIIHAVIEDMGGWMRLCEHNDQNWPFVAKEFETRYRGYKLRGIGREVGQRLIGLAEAENGRNKIEFKQGVVTLGRKQECKQLVSTT